MHVHVKAARAGLWSCGARLCGVTPRDGASGGRPHRKGSEDVIICHLVGRIEIVVEVEEGRELLDREIAIAIRIDRSPMGSKVCLLARLVVVDPRLEPKGLVLLLRPTKKRRVRLACAAGCAG